MRRYRPSQGNAVQIRGPELKEGSALKDSLASALRTQFGDFTELQIQTVGPTVGTSISQRAIGAVFLTSIGILLYLAYAFRQAPHPVPLRRLCHHRDAP